MNYEELLDKIQVYHQLYLNETVIYVKHQLWKIIIELNKMFYEEITNTSDD